jgi:hypothetical protein
MPEQLTLSKRAGAATKDEGLARARLRSAGAIGTVRTRRHKGSLLDADRRVPIRCGLTAPPASIPYPNGQVDTTVATLGRVLDLLVAWYGRYRKGNVTWYDVRSALLHI